MAVIITRSSPEYLILILANLSLIRVLLHLTFKSELSASNLGSNFIGSTVKYQESSL